MRPISSERRPPRRPRSLRSRPWAEPLEDRTVPAPVFWISDADGFWDDATRWSTGKVPGAADDVTIDRGSANLTVTVWSSLGSVNSLTAMEPLAVAGGTITLSKDSSIEAGLSVSGLGFVTVGGTLTLGGAGTISSAVFFSGGAAGKIVNTGTLDLTSASPKRFDPPVVNRGTVTASGTDARFTNLANEAGGVIDLTADDTTGAAVLQQNAGTTNLVNRGTIRRSAGTGTATTLLPLSNEGGALDVRSGLLALGGFGGVSTGGRFDVAAGTTLKLNGTTGLSHGTYTGTYTGSGGGTVLIDRGVHTIGAAGATFDLPAGMFRFQGGSIQGTGTLTNRGELLLDGTAARSISGPSLVNDGTLTFDFTIGTFILHSPGTLTNRSTLRWLNGSVQANIANEAAVNLDGPGVRTQFGDTTLTNKGMLTYRSGAMFVGASLTAGTIANEPGGLIDVRGDLAFERSSFGLGSSAIVNKGVFRRSAGTGEAGVGLTNGLTFTHAGGTVEVQTGTLRIPQSGGFNTGGTWTVAVGAVLDIAGQLAGTYAGSGAGIVRLAFQLSVADGTVLNLTGGGFEWSGGSINPASGFSRVTNAGLMRLVGPNPKVLNTILQNTGTLTLADAGPLNGGGTLVNESGGLAEIVSDADIIFTLGMTAINRGTVRKSGGTGGTLIQLNSFDTPGTVETLTGALKIPSAAIPQYSGGTLAGGTWAVGPWATLQLFSGGNPITTNRAAVTLTGSGAAFTNLASLSANAGTLQILGGTDFTTAGGLSNTGSLTLGTDSTLAVAGAFSQSATGTLAVQLGGHPGPHGQLVAAGAAALGGTLAVTAAGGYTPAVGDTFTLLTSAGRTGAFAATDLSSVPGVAPVVGLTDRDVTLSFAGVATDLRVTPADIAISGPLVAGRPATVTYTARNLGGATATATWTDSLYLSADDTLDPSDRLLGRVTHTGFVPTLGQYTETITAAVPGLLPGPYRVLVLVDSRQQTGDASRANNLAAAAPADVTIAPVPLGGSVGATVAADGESFFRLDVPAGRDVGLRLSGPAAGAADLCARFALIPTADAADGFAFVAGAAVQTLTLAATQGGTYFLRVCGRSPAGGGAAVTLSARDIPFEVGGVTPNRGSAGPVTLTLIGTRLTPDTTVRLVGPGGINRSAAAVTIRDANTAFATFDLAGLPPGTYDLAAVAGGQTATAPAAFTLDAAAIPGRVEVHLSNPDTFRPRQVRRMLVEYRNVGGTDVLAPVIALSAQNGLLRLVESPGEFRESEPAVLGFNPTGPAGVLPPGAGGTIAVDVVTAFDSAAEITLDVRVLDDPGQPFDWFAQKDSLRPAYVPADAWDAVFTNFVAAVGPTLGGFHRAITDDATHLSRLGTYAADLERLFDFEMQQADGFGEISGRFTLGAFGRGRPDPSLVRATTNSLGNVIIQTGDAVRMFLLRPGGVFPPLAGDEGRLTRLADGSLELREVSGDITRFHPDGRLDFTAGRFGNRTVLTYTGGRVTAITDQPTGDTTTFVYDARRRVVRTTDPVGRVFTCDYDAAGEHLIAVTGPGGTTRYEYVAGGGPLAHAVSAVTFPDGTRTEYQYDARGRLVRRSAAGGAAAVSFAYDDAGTVRATDASGAATTVLLNEFGQPGMTIDPLGRISTTRYDAAHRLSTAAGPDGARATADLSDPVTRTVTGALGQRVTGGFTDGRLTSLSDPLGRVVRFGYDARGGLTSITHPDASQEQFTIDAAGNRTRTVNRRGQPIALTYDARRLLTRRDLSGGASVTYDYDAHRNLTRITDGTGTTTLEYDAADRITRVAHPNGRSVAYTYDAGGRLVRTATHDGFAVNYQYDAAGRLARLTDAGGGLLTAYTYDAAGRVVREDRGNGTFLTNEFDPAGRLLRATDHAPGGALIARSEYAYDAYDRPVRVETPDGVTDYGYDASGQLVAVTVNGRTITYEYDAAGNRTRMTDDGVATAYTTNLLNQYTAAGGATFGYDADGNLTSRTDAGGTTTYTYDAEGRFTRVQTPTDLFAYEYDALGNRAAVVRNGVRTEYLYSAAGTRLGEYAGAGPAVAHYAHGAGLVGRIDAAGAAYYGFDYTGNATHLTGPVGQVLNRYQYLPFGEMLSEAEAVTNPFTFSGRYGVQDAGDGLYAMTNRVYDPATGRFTRPDPLSINAGDANLYRYVFNNPVSLADPSGLRRTKADETPDDGITVQPGQRVRLDDDIPPPPTEVPYFVKAVEEERRLEGEREITNRVLSQQYLDNLSKEADPTSDWSLYVPSTEFLGVWADEIGKVVCVAPDAPGIYAGEIDRVTNEAIDYFDPDLRSGEVEDVFTPGLEQELKKKGYRVVPLPNGKAQVIRAADPNEIVGPAGFGADRFLPAQPLGYTVHFENLAAATAPAQTVAVTLPLGPDLDPASVELGPLGFGAFRVEVPAGRSAFATRIDARSAVGLLVDVSAAVDTAARRVVWTFTALDPTTFDAPADPLAGFLPPEDGTGRGQGFVSYTARPAAGRPTGTRIDAKASIVFDTNAPLDTSVHVNTLDVDPPASQVAALPATSSPTFTVSWASGGGSGSGVAAFDVYVSDNGGPFTPFRPATTATSAAFTGVPSHTYAFYSVAADNVGFVEAGPALPDAETAVPANTPPAVQVGGGGAADEGSTFSRAGSFTDPDAADDWTAAVDYGDGSGALPLALNPDKTFALNHVYTDNGTYTATVTVRDAAGADGVGTFRVAVRNVAPTAGAAGPATASAGSPGRSS